MHIKKGDIYGFIGKNGAGKTTLMKRDGKLVKEFDADELNKVSSGKMVIETDDYERACRILAENGIKVPRSYEEREDIESFFIGLVEG